MNRFHVIPHASGEYHSRLAAGYGIALLAALLMNRFFRGGAQGNA